MGLHQDADVACAAITMAVAARGGRQAIWRDEESERVIFHTDRGSTYTANSFTKLRRQLGIRQSMGRVGSCFDNAAAEAFFSSLEWDVLSRNRLRDTVQAQAVVIDWCYTFYNHQRRPAPQTGSRPSTTKSGNQTPSRKRHRKPSTISGDPQTGRASVRRAVVCCSGRLHHCLIR